MGERQRMGIRKQSEEAYYGQDRSTFISKYLTSLKNEDPKLLDFFVTEARKRSLIPKMTPPINKETRDSPWNRRINYGVSIINENKRQKRLRKPALFSEPIDVNRTEKPTHQELF